MPLPVVLTPSSLKDIDDLGRFLAKTAPPGRARELLGRIGDVVESLSENPERGTVSGELQSLGLAGFREVLFKPWMIVYHVTAEAVVVDLIADGRHDMQHLLTRRLLG